MGTQHDTSNGLSFPGITILNYEIHQKFEYETYCQAGIPYTTDTIENQTDAFRSLFFSTLQLLARHVANVHQMIEHEGFVDSPEHHRISIQLLPKDYEVSRRNRKKPKLQPWVVDFMRHLRQNGYRCRINAHYRIDKIEGFDILDPHLVIDWRHSLH